METPFLGNAGQCGTAHPMSSDQVFIKYRYSYFFCVFCHTSEYSITLFECSVVTRLGKAVGAFPQAHKLLWGTLCYMLLSIKQLTGVLLTSHISMETLCCIRMQKF